MILKALRQRKKVSNKKTLEIQDLTMVSESKPVRVPLCFIIVANDEKSTKNLIEA